MKNYLLVLCFSLGAFVSGISGQLTENNITNETKNELLDTISNLIFKNYIFPDMANKMSDMLKNNQEKGKYAEAVSPAQFARMITQDLRDISKDNHISIRYSRNGNDQTNNTNPGPVDTSYGISKVEILEGDIGYLKFNYFPPDSDVTARNKFGKIFTNFKTVNAIIIDLTDNFGGNPRMEVYLCSYFFDATPRHLWDGYYRLGDTTYSFYTQKDIDGTRLLEIPVYVLTGMGTFSAGEAFAYDLQVQKRAKIIGEVTAGGAHATAAFDVGNGFMIRIPITKITNAITGGDWEGVGVKPDIACIQYEARDLAYISALKEVASNTNDKFKKNLLNGILNEKQKQDEKFIKANKKLNEYAGNYGIRKIIYSKGRIYFQRENEPLIPMQESEKDLFIWGDNITKLKFSRNADEAITGFDIIRPNESIRVKKE